MCGRACAAIFALLIVAAASHARAAEGLSAVRSPHPVKETLDRFEKAAKARGLSVFARIDHAAGARKVDRTLRATELLIFGSPQAGTPLIECAQTIGIDLPLKALAWEDASGQVWLGYNDPQFLAQRHRVTECVDTVRKISSNLESLAREAVQ
jgi:uncharacterized protein (DUF302 family)